jgi:hypothetical protein
MCVFCFLFYFFTDVAHDVDKKELGTFAKEVNQFFTNLFPGCNSINALAQSNSRGLELVMPLLFLQLLKLAMQICLGVLMLSHSNIRYSFSICYKNLTREQMDVVRSTRI